MPDERPEPFPQRALVELFAHDELDDARQREAERVLEQSEAARELFRQLTAGRYPRLPNYTIIGQIGKGGFGVVYKAVHHDKERVEALKVLFSKTPLLTEYFQNEVHLIARLRHQNIATLFEAQLSTPPLYYTMEFVEGERLNDYLKKYTVSLAERIRIIRTVAAAIEYAHAQGVVHRDLKPQNILIDDAGQPHVVDFGIAKKLALTEVRPPRAEDTSHESHEGPVGTLGYIAPEQEKGGPVDARADIFALGALLFHCVTGEPARLAKVADQRIRILRERHVTRPDALAAIIGRCVEDSPERRYPTSAAFAADLDNYVTGRAVVAHPSWAYEVFRVAALVMRDFPLTVRVAVVVVVAVFLTWWFWKVGLDTAAGGRSAQRTVMIGFTNGTLQAIRDGRIGADLPGLGADTGDRLSWRMLHGRLMEQLAKAKPLVVAWDICFEECSEFDEYLVRGLDALDAPVIVAAGQFDSDGQPLMCPALRAVVDGYGAIIGADAGNYDDKYEVAYCVQPPFETPIPGLALAAFAASQHPDCDIKLELAVDKQRLRVRYRPRGSAASDIEGGELPLHRIAVAKEAEWPLSLLVLKGALRPDDKVGTALVGARSNAYWSSESRTIAVEDVLNADTAQLKAWFEDRPIVIGQMRPGIDQKTRPNGERVFGCQMHAETLDTLLERGFYDRLLRPELAARNLLWCAVAVFLVSVPKSRNWQSLRWVTLVCVLLFLVGVVVLGTETAGIISTRWLMEVIIAATGLLTAGSLAFWAKAVRERQLGLAPSAITLATEGPTLASTVLAETR